jgi:hypothetical protein
MDIEQPKPMKRVYVPVEDAKLDGLLEASEATGFTVEELIQRALREFLDERRRKALIDPNRRLSFLRLL